MAPAVWTYVFSVPILWGILLWRQHQKGLVCWEYLALGMLATVSVTSLYALLLVLHIVGRMYMACIAWFFAF